MISYCCGSRSPPQAENFDVFELKIEFPPFENMISQCKCLHTEKILHKMYVNILFEIRLYVNMFTYEDGCLRIGLRGGSLEERRAVLWRVVQTT